jgi:hypothetical protein
MRLFIAAALLFLASVAHAARPFVTDDARVVDEGGCQVESFVKRQARFDETEFWILPACDPWGVELTAGHIHVNSSQDVASSTTLLRAKALLKPLATNGSGYAFSTGVFASRRNSPGINGIGSFSCLDDRVVIHGNLGGIRDNVDHRTRGTWGIGAEILLAAPRWYGIVESYGATGEKLTLHGGPRIWLVPNRLQLDATAGAQQNSPERRFGRAGIRILW